MPSRRLLAAWIVLPLLSALAVSCGKSSFSPESPQETLLDIAAIYQLARATDIYRQPVPRDLSGQNALRATVVRLANYENLHPGRFSPEISYLRGQAFADLGDYDLAARHYRICADFDGSLRGTAAEAAGIADEFDALLRRKIDSSDPEAHLRDLDRRAADWRFLAEHYRATRWGQLARIEAEAQEMARAEFLDATSDWLAEGDRKAQEAFEALVRDHSESRRALAHALRLAEFHLERARRLERFFDPERAGFPFNEYSRRMETALDLLHRVSQADGHPEKVLARHRLDEALARLEVVRQRFR